MLQETRTARMFEETRAYLKSIGMPEGDAFDMPTSDQRFPDGGAFRIENPTVNTAETAAALLETAAKNGIAEGDFRVVSPYEASRVMWGAMNGLMLIHEKRTEEITRQKLPRLIQVAVSLLLDGIRAKKV
jgi:hypothetical protein